MKDGASGAGTSGAGSAGCLIGSSWRSSDSSTGDGAHMTSSEPCRSRELSRGKNNSAVGVRDDSLPGVHSNGDAFGSGQSKFDGPGGVAGARGADGPMAVTGAGLLRCFVFCSTLEWALLCQCTTSHPPCPDSGR